MNRIAAMRRLGTITVAGLMVYGLPTALLSVVHSPVIAFILEVVRGGRGGQLDQLDRQQAVRAAAAGQPVFIYGHSLGGLIALGYAVADPPRPQPDGYVLSAPATSSAIPAWKQALARVLGRVMPGLAIPNDFDGGLLSRDAEVGRRYLADPLNQHKTTTRFGLEAIREQVRVRGALARLVTPTLVIHGEADRLVPSTASESLAALPRVTRLTYPDLRHEMHNEPEGRAVIEEVIAWLRTTAASIAAAK
jgi:alpha-beta hydrolase superfamily lysophospholipase